ncbi:MAG: PocR ligand-binding domain-containing protein [Clostridia bacterium]|nr:PocR ligand-binding domain-containing protein [Clostridia bacterium]
MMLLIEKEKLNQILKDFYLLTGVRIAVCDEQRRALAVYPKAMCSYCERHRRTSTAFYAQCMDSDEKAFQTVKATRRQSTYRCHAGLYESVCPILLEDNLLGFLMIGQFIRKEDPPADLAWGGDREGLTELDEERIGSIASIMSICAEYLCFSKTISVRRVGLAARAERYVCDHLNEPLSVGTISNALGISKTSAQTLFQKSFGKSVTEFVNDQKIKEAKRLICAGKSTEEILEAINVSDANYFYRMFKKYNGVSLSAYKRLEPRMP